MNRRAFLSFLRAAPVGAVAVVAAVKSASSEPVMDQVHHLINSKMTEAFEARNVALREYERLSNAYDDFLTSAWERPYEQTIMRTAEGSRSYSIGDVVAIKNNETVEFVAVDSIKVPG